MFTGDPYELDVTEETEVGTALLNVTAIDTDIEENAAVSYSTLSPLVTVDPSTGEVVLATMLDYEMDTRLEIEVRERENMTVIISSINLLPAGHSH